MMLSWTVRGERERERKRRRKKGEGAMEEEAFKAFSFAKMFNLMTI